MQLDTLNVIYHKEPYVVYQATIDVEYAGGRYENGYSVLNSDTGVVEFASPSLPDCLSVATQSAASLVFFANKQEMDIDVSGLEDETIH